MKPLFLFLLAAVSAFAQPFSFGLKAGVPLTDLMSTVQSPNFGFNSTTNRYLLGPEVELRLPFGLGVEFDALYRHYNFQQTGSVATNSNTGAWEFPLLAKYRFPSLLVHPFVDGGLSWDRLQGLTQTLSSAFPNPFGPGSPELLHNTVQGYVFGAGLDVHLLVIHVSPEIRYTRWGSSHFVDPLNLVTGNRNQAEVFLGVTF